MPPELKPPPDYEEENRLMFLQNASEVLRELERRDENLMKRITTFSERFDFSLKDVIEKIRNDKMFSYTFAKEPRRTNFHEKLASQWLQEIELVEDFRVLPKRGNKSYYVNGDGKVINDSSYTKSKSIDFTWRTGNTTCYAMHKYTKHSGGDQDNQFAEMEALLRRFLQCEDKSCILVVIVDGAYYTESKMETLQHITRAYAPKSYAVHIQDVPEILEEYQINRIEPVDDNISRIDPKQYSE